jgi:DNA-binding MarR family transcriptional regulator
LSPRDSALLAHLDERRSITPTRLARHLGIGKSTMSAAVKRLQTLGHIAVSADPQDRRITFLRLSHKGAAAMQGSSVLEPARVRRVLAVLTGAERRRALDGLQLLAGAAQRIMTKEDSGD